MLANAHSLRNEGEYRGTLNVNARIVTDLMTATQAVLDALTQLPPVT